MKPFNMTSPEVRCQLAAAALVAEIQRILRKLAQCDWADDARAMLKDMSESPFFATQAAVTILMRHPGVLLDTETEEDAWRAELLHFARSIRDEGWPAVMPYLRNGKANDLAEITKRISENRERAAMAYLAYIAGRLVGHFDANDLGTKITSARDVYGLELFPPVNCFMSSGPDTETQT